METALTPLTFEKILQTKTYTAIIIKAPTKSFAIYVEPTVGMHIQSSMLDTKKPRPHTHDMMTMIFKGLGVKMKHVVINDLQDSIYYARMVLEQTFESSARHIVEVDARPSDWITLALFNNIPVFCTQNVVDNALAFEE